MENSIEGAVVQTLDTLCEDVNVEIVQELAMNIRECLLLKPDSAIDSIHTIYSHPQPLGQCRKYLSKHFPEQNLIPVGSTTQAIELVHQSEGQCAAIASPTAAELYHLSIAQWDIQDYANNSTRFAIVERKIGRAHV